MHADSIETVINRLENEPINVPRAMVQSLDILSIQTLARVGEERIRRTRVIGELGGIDQRTGELDYSSAFEWNPTDDSFVANDSDLLSEIRDERGWKRSELLRELRRRERFLTHLIERDVSDYRRFTALVNEYYADADRAMARFEADGERGDEFDDRFGAADPREA
jgi:flagellar protein FlaI